MIAWVGNRREGVKEPTPEAARQHNIPVVAETLGYDQNASRQGGGKFEADLDGSQTVEPSP